ncbi:MAG TPA: NADH-quinone oxidoreductase subunit L [Cyclobacteriaceae bacterium]|nr:NADH-quinone oxidoreductase subunit L [Cyclobacteriaceae bacterium]
MNEVQQTSTLTFALLSVAMPVVSAVLCLMIPKRFMWLSPIVSTLLMFTSVILAAILYVRGWHVEIRAGIPWFLLGETTIQFNILIDGLTLPMLSMVILISFLVHLYSVGFMADDQHAGRYFAFLGFFTFSMLGLVISGNLLLLFCFWELVGFSSYLLIGHWRERPLAGAAATKAFIFNRVGDALFIVGLMITWSFSSTFDIPEMDKNGWVTIAGLCFFAGVMGKSAQFPLLTWLPDAMQGPTPVSALIHAATMVAAGVFLILRIPFILVPAAAMVMAIVGGITALYGGWKALHEYDLKKILAYSTISQLGFMILAIGAGSEDGAFLHLLAHAFFKACLFLAAGAVIHSLYHVAKQNEFDPQDIRNMGGFYKITPKLFIATTIATAALCGLPLLSGFVSKEMIIVPMFRRALETADMLAWAYVAVFFLCSMLTVLYSYRMYTAVFFGPRALPYADLAPVPPVMQWPISILAVLSLWIFFAWSPAGPGAWLMHFRKDMAGLSIIQWNVNFPFSKTIALVSFGWTLLSIALGWWLFTKKKVKALPEKYSLDHAYDIAILSPALRASDALARFDKKGIDGFLHLFAFSQVTLAKVAGYVDRYVVDGSVSAVTWIARAGGNMLRHTGRGQIQSYLLWSAVVLIIFIFWILK